MFPLEKILYNFSIFCFKRGISEGDIGVKKAKIALFGGSFDPPHKGHEMIVKKALKNLDIDKLIVMPNYLNPFKDSFSAPANLRYKWLKKIFSNMNRVEVSSFEIDKRRAIPTIESVKYLYNTLDIEKLYIIIGADNLKDLRKWQDFNKLKKLATFVVATRDEIEVPKELKILNISANISSTKLREKIDAGMLPDCVKDEIIKEYKGKK